MRGGIFVTGPAGTGKSTFCGALNSWLTEQQIDSAIVNLDPGAEYFPYSPDLDVRDFVSLQNVMREYSLGPNGAQVVAADLILDHVQEIREGLDDLQDHYVIFDTPGQVELFSFRQGSPILVDSLAGDRGMICFLSDSVVASSPSGFISQKMLFGSVFFRFFKPMIFVLNKTDLITREQLENVVRWEQDPDILYESFAEEKQKMVKDFYLEMVRSFRDSGLITQIFPTSARDMEGFEDIYSQASLIFSGGDDSDTMFRDD
ncbi:MAG: ATP/GTP-binding protein [Candidatus Thermoplasmatota archaeon]|nr:ATP/GTP-binding protein [Candidatus Thermoplasmatota archaeon]MCL5731049.1 ATP/GTP-binding protein [Candidatus Thermoplasmatota archaeon]